MNSVLQFALKGLMMADLRVAIVDEHPVLRDGVKSAIERQAGFAFVASGSEAAHVPEILTSHKVDVLLVDVCVAGDVFRAIAEASSAAPEVTIVIFTDSMDAGKAVLALTAGADAYVLKSSSVDELFHAMNVARGGSIFITKPFDESVFCKFRTEETVSLNEDAILNNSYQTDFNWREIQIVKYLLLGRKNREIAAELLLSERTIKFYVSQLMAKLQVRSRLEIVVFVRRLHPELFDERVLVSEGRSGKPLRRRAR